MKLVQLLFCFLILQSAVAQPKSLQATVGPTVMVIPFAKEGEQLRTVYEQDDMLNLRVAVTQVKDALDAEGVSTIDFRAKIKQVQMDEQVMANNQTSIKQRVIELSGADVYVEIEAAIAEYTNGSSVTVTATAFDAFSGETLASAVGATKRYKSYNFEKLTQRAIGIFIKEFTKDIQSKFEQIIEEGRTVVVNIGFDENAESDMDSEMEDGSLLSDLIEEWIEENAFKNTYHLQGVTATKMIFDEVKIPVRATSGRNYRITKFAAKLRSFLKKQGFDVTRDVVGTKIYITIN